MDFAFLFFSVRIFADETLTSDFDCKIDIVHADEELRLACHPEIEFLFYLTSFEFRLSPWN